MKKLATMFIALIVLGSFPVFASGNTTMTTDNVNFINTLNYAGDEYRVRGNYKQTFNRFVNRGHVDILITGDGSTDLDLYVYAGNTLIGSSDGSSDDEKVCLKISRSGNIRIVVINRGSYANDYQLILK
jgi:hypothetical protein